MKVVIVDDDPIVSLSLKMILEADDSITVAGLGRSGKEAIQIYKNVHPDIMLLNIRMETITGLEAGRIILREDSKARILFLTTVSEEINAVQILHIGASGYILKRDFANMVPALNAVYRGQYVLEGEIYEKLPVMGGSPSGFDYKHANISDKELDIIKLVAQGLNNKEISEKIFLSEGTVRNYLSTIMEKLRVRDRTQLAIFFLENKQK